MSVRVLIGDCRDRLREMPDQSVQCVVTSPPYFGLRDYGVDGQIGAEPTPQEFVGAQLLADVEIVPAGQPLQRAEELEAGA
jgi:DNA modification methylase